MNAGVVNIARARPNGARYGGAVYFSEDKIERAEYRHGVVIELKQIGRFPCEQFVLSRNETADEIPARQLIERVPIDIQVAFLKFKDNKNDGAVA